MRRSFASIGLLLLAGCSGAVNEFSRTVAPVDADQAVVERAVSDSLFGSISRFDYESLRRAVTPDFELVEDTVRMRIEDLVALVRTFEGRATIRYRLSALNTRTTGDVAWTTYRNDGEALFEGQGRVTFAWLETAVLVRRNGTWRIDRLQSNPVTPTP